MVDALVLGTSVLRRGGSSPLLPTNDIYFFSKNAYSFVRVMPRVFSRVLASWFKVPCSVLGVSVSCLAGDVRNENPLLD